MEVIKLNYRHEWKHRINYEDKMILRTRLRIITKQDPHAKNGNYRIRSLYFDTPADKALREKIDSVNHREKFRIRYYNTDLSVIHLEKKCKINGLCQKFKTALTLDQVEKIIQGHYQWMKESEDPLIREFYCKIKNQNLRPKTIVQYTREPYTFSPGNVRITIDDNIRLSPHCNDFLNPYSITMPAGDAPMVLEVKWDAFLPDIIRDAVHLKDRRVTAFSKYAIGRIYG